MLSKLRFLLFSFEGRIGRVHYATAAVLLAVLKYVLDRTIATHHGVPWPVTAYVLPAQNLTVYGIGGTHPRLYWTLWLLTIPFFWAGVSLTLRRIRDIGLRTAWIALFFIPFVNLLLFLFLATTPGDPTLPYATEEEPELPLTPNASLLGMTVAVVVGIALVVFSANYLLQYAWGLFLGVPFLVGFIASWFLNARKLHSRANTIGISITAPLVIGACLLGFRFEGLVCLAMAVPLAVPLSIAGGLTARTCLEGRARRFIQRPQSLSMCIAILPLLMLVEYGINPEPAIRPVVTTIIINAPADVVWRNVVAFTPLDPPKELLFRTGVAYPIGATITGTGPGAIRRCRFSTGDFVEPITTWDENHLLAFSVAEQPPALTEITLGTGPLHTPHIERNYLRSRHGQFKLTAIDANHTLLEGTTWYQDYFWPQFYWRTWSDAIIHRIHFRVLEHVKAEAEKQQSG